MKLDNIPIKTIETIDDYIKLVKDESHYNLFRGHADDVHWKLEPKIVRTFKTRSLLPTYDKRTTWRDLELDIFYRFKRFAIPYLNTTPTNFLDWFVIGQHYGLPTRLLDWTENPLVALFFALNENYNTESSVWVISPMEYTTIEIEENDFISNENIHMFFPKSIDKRIISQGGCFSIHPLPETNGILKPIEEEILEREITINNLWKIVIPNDNAIKKTMMFQLNGLGIGYKFIFPDIVGLTQQIQWELLNDIHIF
jgi:hypothetical protein